ncbi:LPXTG cell wall anchor domain-containing protein [Actinokineospora soli]|uniref:LPXTG cell wall anchor domain-containing protein n=1 Tax=Actinokineospora soli TaxID=1048753 RepID=A0ABW2TKX2_9PSEU
MPKPPTPPTPKPTPKPKPTPDLPDTGASTTPALALGTLLLAAGAITLIATRRRRR